MKYISFKINPLVFEKVDAEHLSNITILASNFTKIKLDNLKGKYCIVDAPEGADTVAKLMFDYTMVPISDESYRQLELNSVAFPRREETERLVVAQAKECKCNGNW